MGNVDGSLERLVAALSGAPETPVLLRGDVGSGRTAVLHEAARRLNLEVIECEAAVLTGSKGGRTPFLYTTEPGGMSTPLDDLRVTAALRDGDPLLVIVDHMDTPLLNDARAVIETLSWMAPRVHVVAVAERDCALPIPAGWSVVDHGAEDVARFWQSRAMARRPAVDIDL